MKKISVLLLLAGMSSGSYADPGDDIWDHIKLLKRAVGHIKTSLNTLEDNFVLVQGTVNDHANKINQLQQIIDALKANQIARHYIGEEYRGGLVFYVDKTGQHGLIASKVDVNHQGIQWRNGASGNKVTNARGDGVGAGETNTRVIISQQTIDNQKGTFAALQAANFQVLSDGVTPCKTPVLSGELCYGGWYLPSAYELQLLNKNLHLNNLSTFAPEFYWSSTEHTVSEAWLMQFATGELISSNKSSTTGRVRAISKF